MPIKLGPYLPGLGCINVCGCAEVGSCFLEDGDVCVCADPGRAVVFCMPVSVLHCCFCD